MREDSFFKQNKKEIIIGAAAGAVLALLVIIFAQPVMNLYYRTPAGRIHSLNALSKLICREHIYADEDDNPLAIAYGAYFETDEIPAEKELKKAMKAEIEKDDDNYFVLANLMLSHFDKYSNLNKVETHAKLYPDNENYKGLGTGISACGPFIRIGTIYENSAAGRAGLAPGDLIFSIGDTDVRTLSYADAQKLLKTEAEKGTTLGIYRMDEDKIFTVDVTAEEVEIPNISYSVEGGTAYLRVELFRGDSFEKDVDAAVEDFRAAGAEYLILDLRDNRGGYITDLEYLLNALVPEKDTLLFSQHYRSEDTQYFSKGGGAEFKEIYVLIDGDTCSSAEVVSGCLGDLGATLIGETTYGKAVGLSNYQFCGDRLVLATMTIELPETGDYNDRGIEPDIEASNSLTELVLPQVEAFDAESVGPDSGQSDILALEQRLELLAYLDGDADGIWDAETDEALAELASGMLLSYEAGEECDGALLDSLTQLFALLENAQYPDDTPLSCAYGLIAENR